MTDVMPEKSFPEGLGYSEEQVRDAFYIVDRLAKALGRGGHGPRIVNTRWDLDQRRFGAQAHPNVVIRCVFVVRAEHYRTRYVATASSRRHGEAIFDLDRSRLETLVKDALEARAVTFDTLYVGVAMGEQ